MERLNSGNLPLFNDIKNFGNIFLQQLFEDIQNPFWKNVLTYYHYFNKHFKIKTTEEIVACSFIGNERIKIGDRVITKRCFINNNIFFIKQLMDGEKFLKYLEFVQKFNVTINLLDFNSVISAVKKYLSRSNLPNITNKTIPYQPALNFIMNTTKGASAIYHSILEPDEKSRDA